MPDLKRRIQELLAAPGELCISKESVLKLERFVNQLEDIPVPYIYPMQDLFNLEWDTKFGTVSLLVDFSNHSLTLDSPQMDESGEYALSDPEWRELLHRSVCY